jgi:hypothetical protein
VPSNIRSLITTILAAAFLLSFTPGRASAQSNTLLPSLNAFINLVDNGKAGDLRGVYAPQVFAYRVVQQPTGKMGYVSPLEDTLTQFGLAAQFGSTGLLAHNHLAGNGFFLLERGQKLHLIYGDGRIETFVVRQILGYRVLAPDDSNGDYLDLAFGGLVTTSELIGRTYDRPGRVILQTCIPSDEDPSWGRLFIIAEPYNKNFRESIAEIY